MCGKTLMTVSVKVTGKSRTISGVGCRRMTVSVKDRLCGTNAILALGWPYPPALKNRVRCVG